MFGELFGKIAAAPVRIIGIIPKVLDVVSGNNPQDTVLDEIGDVIEKQVKKTCDGKLKG